MTRLSILFAVLSFVCAGAAVFKGVTTGRADSFAVFTLMALMAAFVMLALPVQRVSRLEAAVNPTTLTPKDH